MDGSTLHLLDSGQSYVCNGITPTLSAGAHARYHRRIVQFVQNWEADPTAINAILFSICLIFPWGWCKVRIFSQTKRNFIFWCKFLVFDKSCQNDTLTLRAQVSADTIEARPAIPGFAGTCVRTPYIFLFHHTFGLRLMKCALPQKMKVRFMRGRGPRQDAPIGLRDKIIFNNLSN